MSLLKLILVPVIVWQPLTLITFMLYRRIGWTFSLWLNFEVYDMFYNSQLSFYFLYPFWKLGVI